jgi:hypothetical protein
MSLLFDQELAHLYARSLIAVVRADHEIGIEEGLRLEQRINARCRTPIELAELLLLPALDPDELAGAVLGGGPFRGSAVHPVQLAQALVADGVAIVLAKGHATEAEAHGLWRFASALGLMAEDYRALTGAASKWWPSTV